MLLGPERPSMIKLACTSLLSLAALALAGCAVESRSPDAIPATRALASEIAVHIDETSNGNTVRVLAWTATLDGVSRLEALGVVDPLAAMAPEQTCELQDVDRAASEVSARGGAIDLQEFGGLELVLGAGQGVLRPSPRLFPDVAAGVAGVVGEAGPFSLATVPAQITVRGIEDALTVPSGLRLGTVNGLQPTTGAHLDCSGGLFVSVPEGRGSTFEIRPYGSTQALACPVSDQGTVSIPRQTLLRLAGKPGAFAASLETVQRSRTQLVIGARPATLQIEVRSAVPMELRP